MPAASTYRVYPYRWVVLAVFTLVNVTIQTLWIGYAPITGQAAAYYGVSDTAIGAFAMVFMLAFIPLSLPAAWLIDTRGFRVATGLGAVVMGACGILRGLAGDNYWMAMAATLGIAAAQPLLLNAWTKMPARWFAPGQRATAVGVVTVGNLVGTAAGMVLGPVLIESMPIGQIQLAYGVVAALSAVLFLALAREHPPTPACPPGQEERALVLDGLSHAVRVPAFWYVLAIAFIGLGVFNGLTTWVEAMLRPRGFSPADAGTLGAVLLLGGLIGAVVLPALSDRQGRRRRFLVLAFAGAIPGLVGVTLAGSLPLLLVSGFVLGLLPGLGAADRVPVRRRGDPTDPRGHLERADAAVRPGLGGVRLRDVRAADAGRVVHPRAGRRARAPGRRRGHRHCGCPSRRCCSRTSHGPPEPVR